MTVDWYDTDWRYRRELTVASADVSADVTDIPITFDLSPDRSTLTKFQDNAIDLVVTSSDGITKIPHRIEAVESLLTTDGVRSWFTGPTAVRSGDITYTAWTNTSKQFVVASVNHATGAYAEFVLGTSVGSADDHDNPAVHVIQNGAHAGKILCLYSRHFDTSKRSRRSTNAGDISAFDTEVSFSENTGTAQVYTYSHVAEFSDGTIRVWYRGFTTSYGTASERGRFYVDSTDGGATWGTPVEFFIEGNAANQRPYFQQFWDPSNPNRVDFLCTNLSPNEGTSSLYHFYYDHSAATYYQSDGTSMGSTLPFEPADTTAVYLNTDGGEPWCWDIMRTSDGKIGVLFSVDETAQTWTWSDIGCYHGFFDPTDDTWTITKVVGMGPTMVFTESNDSGGSGPQRSYSGGCCFLHGDASNIGDILVSVVDGDRRILKRFASDDDGATWDSGTQFGGKSGNKQFRPSGVRGFGTTPHADLLATWCSGPYTNYDAGNFSCGIGCQKASGQTARLLVTISENLSSSSDNVFYAYYGNRSAADQQDLANALPSSTIFYAVGDISDIPLDSNVSSPGSELSVVTVFTSRESFTQEAGNRHLLSNWDGNFIFRLNGSAGSPSFYVEDAAASTKSVVATDIVAATENTTYHLGGRYSNPDGMAVFRDGTKSGIASPSITQDIAASGTGTTGEGIWVSKTPHQFSSAQAVQEAKGLTEFAAAFTESHPDSWFAVHAASREDDFVTIAAQENAPGGLRSRDRSRER